MNRFLPRVLLIMVFLAGFGGMAGSLTAAQGAETPPGPAAAGAYAYYLPAVEKSEPPAWLGPFGGSVVVLLPDPVNTNIVYAGTWGAGVYKSTDNGNSWLPARGGLWNLQINSMAIDPLNPTIVYAGTYGSGVFKSDNGGETWVQASSGMQDGAIVYAMAVDPEAPNRLYASTRAQGTGEPPWKGILYKSEDGGISWRAVLQNIGGSGAQDWVYAIAVLPRDPNLILAASHEHGVYRSWNYGETWAPANNGILNGSGRGIVFDPSKRSPSTAYYGEWHRDGAYKTTDDGNTWSLLANGIENTKIYSMSIDWTDPRYVYAATMVASAGDTGGVLRSSDSGAGWSLVGLKGLSVYAVAPNRASGSQLYAGVIGNAGVYRSEDHGSTWASSNYGMSNLPATSILVQPGAPNILYTSNTAVYRSTDRGASWAALGSGLPGSTINALVMHPSNPGLLFALTESGLYRLDISSGSAWSKVNGLPEGSALQAAPHPLERPDELQALMPDEPAAPAPASAPNSPIKCMVFAPSNASVVYLGSGGAGVYRSSDGGLTWNQAGLSGQTVWSLAVDPANPNAVYAATNTAATVKFSPDGGATWADTATPGVIAYSLAFDSADPARLLAGTSSGVYARKGGGAWALLGLAGRTVTALAPHPARKGLIFAGTAAGAMFSPDGGITWLSGPSALDTLGIEAMAFESASGAVMYYATSNSGVYRTPFNSH